MLSIKHLKALSKVESTLDYSQWQVLLPQVKSINCPPRITSSGGYHRDLDFSIYSSNKILYTINRENIAN